MQVYPDFDSLSKSDQFMFTKLFGEAELANARWFVTDMHDRDLIVTLVEDMGGNALCHVLSDPDDSEETFLYGIVPENS